MYGLLAISIDQQPSSSLKLLSKLHVVLLVINLNNVCLKELPMQIFGCEGERYPSSNLNKSFCIPNKVA
uniref:Ovule protein n=1 Tax=Strongyloides venezuelensis TaxID=75913 RepID=A0A0K0EWT1_STRVS